MIRDIVAARSAYAADEDRALLVFTAQDISGAFRKQGQKRDTWSPQSRLVSIQYETGEQLRAPPAPQASCLFGFESAGRA